MKTMQIFFDYLRIETLKLFRFLPFYGAILLMVGIGIANFWNFDEQIEKRFQILSSFDPTLDFGHFYLSQIGEKIHFLAYFATLILVLMSMEIEQKAKFFTFRLPVLLLNPHHYLFAKWFIINLLVFILLMALHGTVFEFVTHRFPNGVPYLKSVPFRDLLHIHFWQMFLILGATSFVILAFLLYFRLNWIFAMLILGFCYALGMFFPAFYPFSALLHIHFHASKPFFTLDVVGACLAGILAYFLCYQKIRKSQKSDRRSDA